MSKALTQITALPTALATGIGPTLSMIRTNLGEGDKLGPRDLQILKTPAGGATAWEVVTLEGTDSLRSITGVVIAKRRVRAYWSTRGASGGTPPACVSLESITGIGDPGGSCQACPFAQFGSAVKENGEEGRGQACKQSEELFMLSGESPLPIVVRVSPASLDRVRKFWLLMAQQSRPYYHGMLTVSLEKAQSRDNITFAQLALKLDRWLDPEEAAQATAAHEHFSSVMGLVGSLHDDEADSA